MIFMTVIILVTIDLPGNHATRGGGQAVGIVVVVAREHAGPLRLRLREILRPVAQFRVVLVVRQGFDLERHNARPSSQAISYSSAKSRRSTLMAPARSRYPAEPN